MNSLAVVERESAASRVEVTQHEIIVTLVDGRLLSVPIAWYPRLSQGTEEERNTYEYMGRGTGIHWLMLDEDISVSGLSGEILLSSRSNHFSIGSMRDLPENGIVIFRRYLIEAPVLCPPKRNGRVPQVVITPPD